MQEFRSLYAYFLQPKKTEIQGHSIHFADIYSPVFMEQRAAKNW